MQHTIPNHTSTPGIAGRAGYDPLLDGTALQLAQAIRERRVSSEEVVRAYLARIDERNPHLHAFVEVAPRRALKMARAKDTLSRRGHALPPFHGVPIGIKDLNFVRGLHTRFGSRSMRYVIAPFDDLTVQSLRRAGFVIMGKLATSEVGAMPISETEIHPPTRNPWNLERSPGGSSAGSATAVAAGMLPIAQGSDGGGSIRIPSALCGLFGLKPSRGRVRNAYRMDDPRLLYSDGPIARDVRDAAALLDVLNNGERAERPFQAQLHMELPPLRVHFTTASPFGAVDTEHVAATEKVAGLLEQMGHIVICRSAPDVTLEDFLPLWQAAIASAPLLRSKVEPVTGWLIDGARHLSRRQVRELHDRAEQKLTTIFGDADLWVTPTTQLPAPVIGAFRGLAPAAAFRAATGLAGLTAGANVSGQPACSLPTGLNATGMPIGVQLVARHGQDGLLLAVAQQLEERLAFDARPPWATASPAPRNH